MLYLKQKMNSQRELSSVDQRDRFIEGFKLGARFMLDTFVLPPNSVIADF